MGKDYQVPHLLVHTLRIGRAAENIKFSGKNAFFPPSAGTSYSEKRPVPASRAKGSFHPTASAWERPGSPWRRAEEALGSAQDLSAGRFSRKFKGCVPTTWQTLADGVPTLSGSLALKEGWPLSCINSQSSLAGALPRGRAECLPAPTPLLGAPPASLPVRWSWPSSLARQAARGEFWFVPFLK